MNAKYAWLAGAALLSAFVFAHSAQNAQSAAAQTGKPYKINRLYTGPDGQRIPVKERGRAKKRLMSERALADLDGWLAGPVKAAAE